MVTSERRSSPRIRPGRLVRITFLEPSKVSGGTLVDISEHGAGVLVDSEVAPATTLHIELDGHLLVGTVLYCMPAGEHFRLGLHLVHHLSATDWQAFLERFH